VVSIGSNVPAVMGAGEASRDEGNRTHDDVS